MDRPLEIAFHNIQSSPSLEEEIRKQVERLEQRYGRLTGCRVSIEALHQQHQTGNLCEVHIIMSVPGGRDLAVSHEPHHAKERRAHPDVRTCVRDAFKAAERQLESFKGRQSERTAVSPSAHAMPGQVSLIEPGADHGFLIDTTGTQLYFHRDSVTNGRFEGLKRGDSVHYVMEDGDAGPVAVKVRLAS
ncbi:HPF/RaiA family ribosome-associated protein [Rhizosaccharibacter radicis]|uniref:HPF/RaiA family ribosome-associated protein n=1 Tax=Rhizosaccharibacter radicis TaxID=2782605 RepID=A0ABT1VVY5_9PROT|nr:HPF/RaiA family ribosome-associated protein [Acetobacteraceae bacterium KSS12]